VTLTFNSVLLFYRPKSRKEEAQRLAPTDAMVRYREAKYFAGGNDVEFLSAKAGEPPVNYPRVLVLQGSPNQKSIVSEYGEWGVSVEVVSAKAPPPVEAPSDASLPDQPNFRKMKKADLRVAAMKHYRHNFPTDLKVKEMREWIEGQPWPPVLPRVAEPRG